MDETSMSHIPTISLLLLFAIRIPFSPDPALGDFSLEIITVSGNVSAQVIESFSCKETSKVFLGKSSRKFPGDIQPRALLKLRQIHRIVSIDQLRQPPSNRLESLSGDLKGFWSIRINQQWRIVFQWESGSATHVRIADYH